MAEPALSPLDNGPGASRGVLAGLLSFSGSFGQHLQALLALAGHESKEAARLYLRLLIMLIAALVFAVLGYLFLLLFVAFLLATVFGISWIWIALSFAALHLIVMAVCAWQVKTHLPSPIFTATSAELKRGFDSLKRFEP